MRKIISLLMLAIITINIFAVNIMATPAYPNSVVVQNLDVTGKWTIDWGMTYELTGKSDMDIAGSAGRLLGGEISFNSDSTMNYFIGAGYSGDGSYIVFGNAIECTVTNMLGEQENLTIEFRKDDAGNVYLAFPYGDYLVLFSKAKFDDVLTYEDVIGKWNIFEKLTMYHSGYWPNEIFGDDIDFDSRSLRLYSDMYYEYDVIDSDITETGTCEVSANKILFHCENVDEPDLKEIEYSLNSDSQILIKIHNDLPIIYYLSLDELPPHTTPTEEANEEPDEYNYIYYLNKALENSLWDEGKSALFDMDDDGIEELFILHSANVTQDGREFQMMLCDVYKMQNGIATPLIENEALYYLAGVPRGHVAIAEINGDRYFLTTCENGESSGLVEYNTHGNWNFFEFDGNSFKFAFSVEYNRCTKSDEEDSYIYEKSSAVIDGKDCSFEEYEEWENNIDYLFKMPNPESDTKTIPEMIEYLKENPIVTSTPEPTPIPTIEPTKTPSITATPTPILTPELDEPPAIPNKISNMGIALFVIALLIITFSSISLIIVIVLIIKLKKSK